MSAYMVSPVNAEAFRSAGARLGITEGMLVSSSVPESPPAAYAGATSYALDALVSTGAPGGVITVWRSLQAGNVGHVPTSSPLWWVAIGDTYSEWVAATAWAADARVVRSVAGVHAIFQRLAPGGADADLPESSPTKWARVGATNRWAMFDMRSAAATVAVSPLTLVLAPGRVQGLALLGADSGNVTVTMVSGGDVIFESEQTFDSASVGDWEDYFFAEFETRSSIVLPDLPTYSDGLITVTIASDAGTITLAKCVVGPVQDLGDLLGEPGIRSKSYAVVERDDYGELTDITPGKRIPLVSAQFMLTKARALSAKRALDTAQTVPCVFVGMSSSQDSFSELLTLLALCTDNDLTPKNTIYGVINAELEGV